MKGEREKVEGESMELNGVWGLKAKSGRKRLVAKEGHKK